MASYTVNSNRYGKVTTVLDDADYRRVIELGGKWCVVLKRNKYYFQKRIGISGKVGGQIIELHRWLMNFPEGKYVDHIDGNTLNNSRKNLRACSNGANLRNGKIRSNNKSGVLGVCWEKSRNKWGARIKVNYKTIHLGRYDKLEDAAKAVQQARRKYFDV